MRRRFHAQVVVGAAVLAVLVSRSPIGAGDEPPVYTRVDVSVAASGEASLRRAYTKRLELPWPDCSGEPFGCVRDEIYAQVYEIEFLEETVTRAPDDSASFERVDRGRVFLAFEFPVEVERSFEDALSAYLRSLSVAAYARPQAGSRFLRGPFRQQTFRQSGQPAWMCTASDGAYAFDLVVPGEGGERTFSRGGEIAASACRAIAEAVEEAPVDVYLTMPDVRSQTRHEVRLAEASTLQGVTWADRLARIPEGATFDKAPLEGGRLTGGMRDRRDGFFVGHEGRYGEVERDVRLPPASLDVVGAPMWATRWSFESVREQFGDAPRRDPESAASILIALLPISDPLMEDLDRPRTALTVPRKQLIDGVLALVRQRAALGPDLIVDAFANPRLWPPAGDWMVLACPGDGSGRYGVAPFGPDAEVTNPREACAAVAQVIGD